MFAKKFVDRRGVGCHEVSERSIFGASGVDMSTSSCYSSRRVSTSKSHSLTRISSNANDAKSEISPGVAKRGNLAKAKTLARSPETIFPHWESRAFQMQAAPFHVEPKFAKVEKSKALGKNGGKIDRHAPK